MPRRKKTAPTNGLLPVLATKFLSIGEELLEEHGEDMNAVLEAAETGKLAFSLRGLIDTSESRPRLHTVLRFSEVHTDERVVTLEDPRQGTFTDVIAAATKEKGKRDKKTRLSPNDAIDIADD